MEVRVHFTIHMIVPKCVGTAEFRRLGALNADSGLSLHTLDLLEDAEDNDDLSFYEVNRILKSHSQQVMLSEYVNTSGRRYAAFFMVT